jgi:cation diffusion facilitator CzcD-associated flavoprotein CzcO
MRSTDPTPAAHVDVLVLGAGVSGIGVACHLAREVPKASFLVLERRRAIGGTWDLFRYPGVRSDSDMYTFGYRFKPWHGNKVLADGESIKAYIEEAAQENGVTERIRFGQMVIRSSWSSTDAMWTVDTTDESTGEQTRYTSRFLVMSTGFYRYDAGHRPTFPDEKKFAGQIVHPQHWPEDLDYSGKRVVVIGSGATAVTLVPSMAATAKHVTMLQRSPGYIVPVPSEDPMTAVLSRLGVPPKAVYKLGRARNIAIQQAFYKLSKASPALSRTVIRGAIRAQVGSKVGMEHFDPSYNPWDERLCVVPNGDLFSALRRGKATVVTDHIDRFTKTGIKLKSGAEIPADLVVAATGFEVQLGGGMEVEVDGEPVALNERVIYRGFMVDGVPNSMVVLGYTNATWTLKVDLVAEYFCRLVKHMHREGYAQVVAVATPEDRSAESVLAGGLSSGYVRRAESELPRQGTRNPWKNLNDYYRDVLMMRRGAIEHDALSFTRAHPDSAHLETGVVREARLPA